MQKHNKHFRMFFGAVPPIFKNAAKLRKNMTDAEKLLWFHLKQSPKGYKFRRQHPLRFYIADFYCHRAKLVVEVDGSIHDLENVKFADEIRQKEIESEGLTVIRFTNADILKNIEHVLDKIYSFLE